MKNSGVLSLSEVKALYLNKRRSKHAFPSYMQNVECKLKVQAQFFSNLRSLHESHFMCPICFDYLVAPRATHCGHVYCNKCIDEHLLTMDICPVCRTYIKDKYLCYSFLIDDLIARYIESSNEEAQKTYQQRVSEYNKWLDERNLVDFLAGTKVDARDTEHIWCQGEIAGIENEGHEKVVKIHYMGWSRIYDEYLPVKSERLAKRGFYTNRTGELIRHTDV